MHRPHEDYERTIQRHLAFIDKLIEEKQELTDQCQKLAHAVEEIAKKSENKYETSNTPMNFTAFLSLSPLIKKKGHFN